MAPGVVAQLRRVQFSVVDGRIVATCEMPIGRLNFSSKGLGREERLSIDFANGVPSLDYLAATRAARLTINVTNGDQLRVIRNPTPGTKVPALNFTQLPGLPLSLKLGEAEQDQTLEGASIWHLLLAEPDLCRQHLLPILEILRPGWQLHQAAADLEAALVKAAQNHRVADRHRLQALVDQLADDDFAKRQAADQALRDMGQAALPLLHDLNPQNLDAEQRFRLRRMVAALSGQGSGDEDHPQRLISWLAGDPQVWLALMSRDDETCRKIAADQLRRILGHGIDFDPRGDATQRDSQLTVLRKEVGFRVDPQGDNKP